MSKIHIILTILLLVQPALLFAQETPVSNGGGEVLLLSEGTYSGFEETTYSEPNWVLAISDAILRKDICVSSDPQYPNGWYEKVFEPCYNYQGKPSKVSYWSLESCSEPGEAYPLQELVDASSWLDKQFFTLDSLYVREGFGFQLYGPDEQPYGPFMVGPQYVSITHWINRAPDGFEPGTFFVWGGSGELSNYSIILYPNFLNLNVEIEGEPNCVVPGDFLTYKICFDPGECSLTGVKIINRFSREVDFKWAVPDTGNYSSDDHTYTWDFGDIQGGDPNCYYLIVEVNASARPSEQIVNKVEAISDNLYFQLIEKTQVCSCAEYRDRSIRRVDIDVDAQGPDGSSWDKAYNDLQDALEAAYPCDEIWVAEGTYKPTSSDPNISFDLKYVGLYGGFKGVEDPETKRYERNWFDNETILSGDLYSEDVMCVVTIIDANAPSIIDGFTITKGVVGIGCKDAHAIIQHNRVADNTDMGLYFLKPKGSFVKNNWIYENEFGIYLDDPVEDVLLRNNTITNNSDTGLYFAGSIDPTITNCIIWGNDIQLDWDYTVPNLTVTYSCIEDSNDTTPTSPYYNINTDPCFYNAASDDYHLSSDSPCIDAGDPNGNYNNQRDIDKEFRVLDGDDDGDAVVDMGADEYCNEGDSNVADFNEDEIVNYIDFAEFGIAWLQGPSDPNWNNGLYDLDEDNTIIDTDDLVLFANEWLWMSCSKMQEFPPEQMMSMGMETATQSVPEPTIEEQIERAENNLDWLNKLWQTDKEVRDTIDQDRWEDFIENVKAWIEELEDSL